jgi:leucine dehydrogenase
MFETVTAEKNSVSATTGSAFPIGALDSTKIKESTMQRIWSEGYENVSFFYDEKSKTHSIISIHNTNLGPSLGGTRIYKYASIDAALDDVLRLSKGMTYKAAIANLPLGGGKSIIWADPKTEKTEAMLKSHAQFVESLNGRYISAEDSGTTAKDIDYMRQYTRYVVGTSVEKGGSGDPSPYTARGVVFGMKACAEHVLDKDLKDCTIALQGAGNVGSYLVRFLKQLGAKVYVADVDQVKVKNICNETGAIPTTNEEIIDVACDIFSPNALGAVLDQRNVSRLKCKVVAGAANNQLRAEEFGHQLHERKIFYALDYVINAGGLISVCCEWLKFDADKRDLLVAKIEETISEIIHTSEQKKQPPHLIAEKLAEARFMSRKN